MKIGITFVVCFLFLSTCNLAQAQNEGKIDPVLQQEYPEDKAEIEKLVHDLYAAIKSRDFEKSKTFHAYSDKFTAFYSGKKRKDAEGAIEFEKNLHNNIPEGIQFDIEDLQVNVFHDVAVATFHIYVSSEVDGEKKQSQAQITLVYIQLDGNWKITHEHVSALTEKREE